ncbi:MAG TPA: hypothetical protein VGM58_07730 [Verrucomicrobiae bacterium]|jgi:hypothetical protein
MRKFCVVLIVACCSLAFTSRAQDTTNAPKTEIENFELQTGTVIVKGLGEIGSVTTSAGVISVRCKESIDENSGRKEYGIGVALASNQLHGFLVVDYDELDSLIRGLDFLGKITFDATTMPSFDATFATKSGLLIAAHSEQRQGAIQDFLQFADTPRIPLTSVQFAQFQNLITQAKASLDALKNKNSMP